MKLTYIYNSIACAVIINNKSNKLLFINKEVSKEYIKKLCYQGLRHLNYQNLIYYSYK